MIGTAVRDPTQAAGLKLDIIGFSAATSACEKGWQRHSVGPVCSKRGREWWSDAIVLAEF